jgi:predicted regulator of Ras-like GTPase activity (Roadblock/LC7/MglB family)
VEQQQQQAGLEQRLSRLNQDAEAKTTMLITRQGNCLMSVGDLSYLNVTAISALVAGMFSATQEVARLVGEDKFSILLQQGEKRNIYISLIDESVMLLIIFDDYMAIGKVRYVARKALKEISKLYGSEKGGGEAVGDRFKEFAITLIDRIFEEK